MTTEPTIETLTTERDALQTQVTGLTEVKTSLDEANTGLTTKSEAQTVEITGLNTKVGELTTTNESLTTSIEAAKAQGEEIKTAKAALLTSEATVKTLTDAARNDVVGRLKAVGVTDEIIGENSIETLRVMEQTVAVIKPVGEKAPKGAVKKGTGMSGGGGGADDEKKSALELAGDEVAAMRANSLKAVGTTN
jgi:chromosome segregation ATPase